MTQRLDRGAPGGHQTVLILDFGSQYTQLIARRVRENRVYCEVHPCDMDLEAARALGPIGVILSGGPGSVYEDAAPQFDSGLLDLGAPVLGICYGMQLLAHRLGGEVEPSAQREYGRARVAISHPGALFAGLEESEDVWMSHGDRVRRPPAGFAVSATTDTVPVVGFENAERRLYGIQFHPEVSHTVNGGEILRNFLYGICGAGGDWAMASFLEEAVESIRFGRRRMTTRASSGAARHWSTTAA